MYCSKYRISINFICHTFEFYSGHHDNMVRAQLVSSGNKYSGKMPLGRNSRHEPMHAKLIMISYRVKLTTNFFMNTYFANYLAITNGYSLFHSSRVHNSYQSISNNYFEITRTEDAAILLTGNLAPLVKWKIKETNHVNMVCHQVAQSM